MPRMTRYAGQPLNTLGGRVELVLRELYHGDQSKMAAESGNSQPQISLVVRGERSPGRRFIENVAKNPRVNSAWLRTGAGQPIVPAGGEAQLTAGRSLPIASCPLPGSPQVNASLLSGASFPVAEPFFKESRYFYAAQKADPVVRAELDIRPNDLMLFETDAEFWRSNVRVLVGKLCALKLRTGSGTVCVLARAKPAAGRHEPDFEIFGGPYGNDPESPDPERELIERHGKGSRCIEVSESNAEPFPPAGPTSRPAEKNEPTRGATVQSPRPSVEDVAGLCLLLIRTDLGP